MKTKLLIGVVLITSLFLLSGCLFNKDYVAEEGSLCLEDKDCKNVNCYHENPNIPKGEALCEFNEEINQGQCWCSYSY